MYACMYVCMYVPTSHIHHSKCAVQYSTVFPRGIWYIQTQTHIYLCCTCIMYLYSILSFVTHTPVLYQYTQTNNTHKDTSVHKHEWGIVYWHTIYRYTDTTIRFSNNYFNLVFQEGTTGMIPWGSILYPWHDDWDDRLVSM